MRPSTRLGLEISQQDFKDLEALVKSLVDLLYPYAKKSPESIDGLKNWSKWISSSLYEINTSTVPQIENGLEEYKDLKYYEKCWKNALFPIIGSYGLYSELDDIVRIGVLKYNEGIINSCKDAMKLIEDFIEDKNKE